MTMINAWPAPRFFLLDVDVDVLYSFERIELI